MKTLFAFLFAVATVLGFIGLAEAGVLTDIITYIKTNMPMSADKIPLPAFMFLLAIGIIGIFGIRRR